MTVLRTRGLGWSVGGAVIVADVDLSVAEGEFLAVIGPNGAGKTSLFNLLSGVLAATTGSVLLDGRDVTRLAPHRRTRLGLGRTFQTASLFPALTVAENVRLAAQAHAGAHLRLWGRADRLPGVSATAADAIARVGLAARSADPAGGLSHGDKRKLELAVLLAQRPRVLLLDEPMAGVSAEEVPALVALIGELHRTEGRTVLMVEHHMDVLLGLADRVAVMHHGRLLACDTPRTVMADPTVQASYLGEPL
ncbi:ABC transporter ATP-binding protein [Longispora sp. K20-0274]|uniref:ABC transporter ATP-binding protein n=1 Tax=Longispora sp. K20-0274 TaxID=3088255 RepID=UPI00399ADEE4